MGMAKWGFNGGSEGGEGRLEVVDEGFVGEKGVECGGGDEDWWCCHGGLGIFFFFYGGKNGIGGLCRTDLQEKWAITQMA